MRLSARSAFTIIEKHNEKIPLCSWSPTEPCPEHSRTQLEPERALNRTKVQPQQCGDDRGTGQEVKGWVPRRHSHRGGEIRALIPRNEVLVGELIAQRYPGQSRGAQAH